MQEADHILIPLLNGEYALAQVAYVGATYQVVLISDATTTPTTKTRPLGESDIIAFAQVSRDAIPDGHWPVIGYEAIPKLSDTATEPTSEPDIQDPAIIEAFANAIHGLYPWDGFPDPAFFTDMLRNGDTLPPKARMSADFPKPEGP